jgi:ketosteroid isomerase-like protein
MNRTTPFLLLLALASCGSGPTELAKGQDATAEFKPIVEKLLAAWSTLDTKNPAPFYAKDAGLTFYDIAPLKYTGWAEYEAGFQKIAGSWKSIKLTLNPDLQATRNGNYAWATYTATFEVVPKEGEPMKADARSTDIFEKRGDDWVIIHEHVSAPMPEPPPPPPAKK